MIALHLLGPIDLRGPDGSMLRAALAQPKRLALLAYLAAAHPRGCHSRDLLMALLWPELDAEHARAALRQAVYVLRRTLCDDDILVGFGDSALGVNPDALWCDANAFEDASAAGDYEKALTLYRGEVLAGFHLCSTPEFERWIEGTRSRFAAAAAAAATRMADVEEQAGNALGALHWTCRLLDISPDDESAIRRKISLLHRVGDRARAIRVYEEFARRIEADYGFEPSLETRELVATVRGRKQAPGQELAH